VGFNEPGSSLASHTRLKTLMGQTRADNARFFAGDIDAVPHHCLTQGLGTIMAARHIFLIATGRAKAEAVHQHHRHVTVLSTMPPPARRLLLQHVRRETEVAGALTCRRPAALLRTDRGWRVSADCPGEVEASSSGPI
jgi:glucosamine-6-phosphate deaminase